MDRVDSAPHMVRPAVGWQSMFCWNLMLWPQAMTRSWPSLTAFLIRSPVPRGLQNSLFVVNPMWRLADQSRLVPGMVVTPRRVEGL